MGFCSERIISPQINGWKNTNIRKVEKTQIINWVDFAEKTRGIVVIAEKVKRKRIGKKKYRTTKGILKSRNLKET